MIWQYHSGSLHYRFSLVEVFVLKTQVFLHFLFNLLPKLLLFCKSHGFPFCHCHINLIFTFNPEREKEEEEYAETQ